MKPALRFWAAWLCLCPFSPSVFCAEAITAWVDEAQFLIPFIGLVTGDRVSLRVLPGRSGEVLEVLTRGTRLRVLVRQGDWYGVAIPSQIQLFVWRSYVKEEPQGRAGQILGNRVLIRSGPGKAYSVLGLLHQGEQVEIRDRVGDWVAIAPPASTRGWVHRSYVTFLERIGEAH